MSLPGDYLILKKLRITAYEDVKRQGLPLDTFKAMFNPASVQKSYAAHFRKKQAINSTGREAVYMFNPPSELEMTLVLDGSMAGGGARLPFGFSYQAPVDIRKEVDKFKSVAYDMNGDLHEPNFLVLSWGTFIYHCRLLAFTVHYSNFTDGGRPVRAEISARFIHDMPAEDRKKKANKNSPDLTHKRTVKTGDTLPFLCKQIYGDAAYYLLVARHNELDDFRNPTPGTELHFPPLDVNEQA